MKLSPHRLREAERALELDKPGPLLPFVIIGPEIVDPATGSADTLGIAWFEPIEDESRDGFRPVYNVSLCRRGGFPATFSRTCLRRDCAFGLLAATVSFHRREATIGRPD